MRDILKTIQNPTFLFDAIFNFTSLGECRFTGSQHSHLPQKLCNQKDMSFI